METTPENLKKEFKIVCYRILSYGEKKGHISTYFDDSGHLDGLDSSYFVAGEDYRTQHEIETDGELDDYFIELMRDAVDNNINYDERGGDVTLEIDVENKILSVHVSNNVYKENHLKLKLNYNRIKHLSPDFDSIVEEYRHIGPVIVADYEGGGDSGWLEGNIHNQEDPDISETLNDRLEEFYYEILSQNFGAWGDNEGSRGKIILDLEKKEILVDHVEYLEDTELSLNVIQKKVLI
jgi:hypothetical protein